ncbi:MAG TPA: ABC transporter substrate-binding protein [Anaerolineales bacterium]
MSRKKSARPVPSWLKVGFSVMMMASLLLAACAPTAQPTAVQTAPAETKQPASPQPAPAETTQPAAPQSTQQPAQPPTAQPTPMPAQPAERKVATFIWTQEFDSLNPLYTNMWFSTVTQQLWLAWAWDYDEKNEAHPKLVKEIPTIDNGGVSADGKTITIKLRDDIKWSDGQPLTADDFLFTYKMAIEPKNTVNTAYPYDKVETMEAPDAYTVVTKFKEVFAPWGMMWRGILPAHVLKPVFDQEGTLDKAPWNLAPTVGLGPYVFKEWESGSFARFVVNDNYWGSKPKIDEVFFRFVPDDASQVKALQAGDGDLGAFIAYSDVPPVGAINPATRRSRVVFPEPLGPVSSRKSPAATSRSSLSITRLSPKLRESCRAVITARPAARTRRTRRR